MPTDPKHFEVTVTIRNNRIKTLRAAKGYPSASAFARAAGLEITTVCAMEALRWNPRSNATRAGRWTKSAEATNGWKPLAIKVATLLGVLPEDLWPPEVLNVAKTKGVFEANAEELKHFAEQIFQSERQVAALPDVAMEEEELRQTLERALTAPKDIEDVNTLNAREQLILRRRFGLDGQPEALFEELGKELGINRERVRQLEKHALDRLRQQLIK